MLQGPKISPPCKRKRKVPSVSPTYWRGDYQYVSVTDAQRTVRAPNLVSIVKQTPGSYWK